MSKIVLAAASFEKQQFFVEPKFAKLPESIKEEVRVICVTLAQKLGCTFLVGFYEDGEVYFETVYGEDVIDFDEIGAALEIKEITRTKQELLRSLQLWYVLFFTDQGAEIEKELLQGEN